MSQVLLAGSDEEVTPAFAEKHDRVRTVVSSEVIGMDEHPANASRARRMRYYARCRGKAKAG